MKAKNIVKTLMTALQSSDLDEAATLLSANFVLRGWTLEPLGKGEFLAMQSELLNALPDFSFGLSELKEHLGRVSALIHVSGTHTNDLALPLFGLELIPATGLAIDLPQVHTTMPSRMLCKGMQETRKQGTCSDGEVVRCARRWAAEKRPKLFGQLLPLERGATRRHGSVTSPLFLKRAW